jgi:hypothetical protein
MGRNVHKVKPSNQRAPFRSLQMSQSPAASITQRYRRCFVTLFAKHRLGVAQNRRYRWKMLTAGDCGIWMDMMGDLLSGGQLGHNRASGREIAEGYFGVRMWGVFLWEIMKRDLRLDSRRHEKMSWTIIFFVHGIGQCHCLKFQLSIFNERCAPFEYFGRNVFHTQKRYPTIRGTCTLKKKPSRYMRGNLLSFRGSHRQVDLKMSEYEQVIILKLNICSDAEALYTIFRLNLMFFFAQKMLLLQWNATAFNVIILLWFLQWWRVLCCRPHTSCCNQMKSQTWNMKTDLWCNRSR